jgi:preprotein translocase subunit SecY
MFKRFITTIKNIFSIEELRSRIITTLLLLLVFRLGTVVVLPGIDVNSQAFLDRFGKAKDGVLGILDTFLGGAFSNASIFALGIMPYISASIVVQLLTVALPQFQKMQKEGESGRKRMNQITRFLTVLITIVQASAYLTTTIPSEAVLMDINLFRISSIIILTSGTIFCMWLGEKITDKGIGNGISMLIMIGIVSRLVPALVYEGRATGTGGILRFLIELVVLYFIVMGVVLLTQATRRIPVQYAKQVIGNKVYGGQRQYIPLKLNTAGVMPIIFAQTLMFLPTLVAGLFAEKNEFASTVATIFADYTSWQYSLLFAVLIIIFTFFYTAIAIDPKNISDSMRQNGGFVPGIKPGEPTTEFIDNILSRITLPGALFLVILAILPSFASRLGVGRELSQFFGGTSLLIMVGVVLDTLQQIESYLLMRRYEGLMQTGKVKGRLSDTVDA